MPSNFNQNGPLAILPGPLKFFVERTTFRSPPLPSTYVLAWANRVKETWSDSNSVSITLSGTAAQGPPGAYFTFAQKCTDGQVYPCLIEHQNQQECIIGHYLYTAATNLLSLQYIEASTSGGEAVTFTTGTKYISIVDSEWFHTNTALLYGRKGGQVLIGGRDVSDTLKLQSNPFARQFVWPIYDGTTGQVLTTDAGGNLSWATAAGGITALTGDVTASGTGSVAATVVSSNNLLDGYTTTATAGGTTTLTASSTRQQLFTGTLAQTVVLPVASTLTTGFRFRIVNNSSNTLTINSSGAFLVVSLIAGTEVEITCILASGTSATSWSVEYCGFSAITGTGSCVLAASPTLTNPTLTSPALGTPASGVLTNCTGITYAGHAANVIREQLTANRTYYVRTDGSDSNSGTADTAGGAFLTLQKAVNVAVALDLATYAVTIQLRTGTRTEQVVLKDYIGTGPITILGDETTPSNCTFNATSGSCFAADAVPHSWVIRGVKTTTTTYGQCIQATNGSTITFYNVDFGVCAGYQAYADRQSALIVGGDYKITAGALAHWYIGMQSQIYISTRTVTITGTPAFTNFLSLSEGSAMYYYSVTWSGSATGTRYTVNTNSVAQTNGAGTTALPGNVAGSTATGGQYV